MLFYLFLDKHKKEAYKEQCARDPDGVKGKRADEAASQSGAYGEEEDYAEIVEGFVKKLFIPGQMVSTQGFHAASDIADTHGAGEGVAVDLAEGLDLHGAGKGYHGVGTKIKAFREKAYKK